MEQLRKKKKTCEDRELRERLFTLQVVNQLLEEIIVSYDLDMHGERTIE